MSAQSDSKTRFFRRLSMIMAALAVLAVLIGFAYFTWRDRSQKAGIQTIVVDGAAPAGQANDRRGQQRRGDRLVVRNGQVEAFAGPIQLHIEQNRPPHLHHDDAGRWTNREQEELLETASRIVRGENRLAALGISSEQKAQLAALNLYRRMALSEADQQKLAALHAAWKSAADGPPKAAAEQQLLAGVKEIGTRSTEASRTAITASAVRVKEILTPDQLDRYRQITRAPRPQQQPAARPATRPAP